MQIIDCELLANKIKEEIKIKLQDFKFRAIPKPHVVMIRVGDNSEYDTSIYNELGIKFSVYDYKESVTTEHLKSIINKLSLTPTVTGIIIKDPLPYHIDRQVLIDEIDPIKDICSNTTTQAGMLQLGINDKHILIPPLEKAIIKLLESITDLKGKNVVIASNNCKFISLANILQKYDTSVTFINKSECLEHYIYKSDIVILATDKPKYFNSRYFYGEGSDDKIIIDTGIHGDLNIEDVSTLYNSKNFKYTLPFFDGGIYPIVIASLLENIYIAYENQFDFIWKYCQNLEISSKGIATETPKNIIKLDIDNSHPTLVWDEYSQNVCKTQVVDKVDLTKINVIVFPEYIRTVSMSFVEGFINLFPIERNDFYKYFEIEASMSLRCKFLNTIGFKLNV